MSQYGEEKSEFCLKQGSKIGDLCLKQGQGLNTRAAPHYPSICWVPPSPILLPVICPKSESNVQSTGLHREVERQTLRGAHKKGQEKKAEKVCIIKRKRTRLPWNSRSKTEPGDYLEGKGEKRYFYMKLVPTNWEEMKDKGAKASPILLVWNCQQNSKVNRNNVTRDKLDRRSGPLTLYSRL